MMLSSYIHDSDKWLTSEFPSIAKPWNELCHDYLPSSEHAKLREKLLRLEDMHGPWMRKRFPPDEGSLAAEEEEAWTVSVSL